MPDAPAAREEDLRAVDLESVAALQAANDRDELFLALLQGAFVHLAHVQLLLARGEELRGFVALDQDGFDDRWVRQRRLPLKLLSVACRTAKEGIPYLGPLPDTDPLAALLPAEPLFRLGVAIFPLRLGDKLLGVLLGHARRKPDRLLRDSLSLLAAESAQGLARLLELRRLRETAPSPKSAGTKAGPEAAPSDDDDFDDDDWPRQTKPEQRDVGAGRPARRHKSTLLTTPTPGLAVAVADDSSPVLLLTKKKPSEPVDAPPPKPIADELAERRTASRYQLKVEVHHRSESVFFTGFMEDISEGGLFVTTYSPLAIGDRLELTFTVPGFINECTVSAEVRWIRPGTTGPNATLPGMGLSFLGLPEAMRRAIRRFVETHVRQAS